VLWAAERQSFALPRRGGGLYGRYATAFQVLVAHDAFVDKFVGDEVIGIFVPALTKAFHAREAVAAGLELLVATGHGSDDPWIRVGIGINTGVAYVGAVGTSSRRSGTR
jgi:adenylate cyclase